MSAANIAVIATALLTAVSVFPDAPDQTGLTFLSSRDAVAQDAWPVVSGTIAMPHLHKPLEVQNGFRGGAPANAPLYFCITAKYLNVDVLESWLSTLNTTVPFQIYVVVTADMLPPKDKQLFVRRLSSLLRTNLAVYAELNLQASDLPGFMPPNDEIMLIQRDFCMRLIGRHKRAANAFVLAVSLDNMLSASDATHVYHNGVTWLVRVGSAPFSVIQNALAGQNAYFAVPTSAEFNLGQLGAQVVFDATGSWQLERLRVGPSVVGGFVDGMAGHLLFLWSRSKQDLFLMTHTVNKTYALAARALVTKGKYEEDLHVIIRTLNFGVDGREEHPTYPLSLGRCATYNLNVLESAVTSTVEEGGQRQKRKGVIGRVNFKLMKSMESCVTIASSGMPMQMCQPQSTPMYHMRGAYGEEPKPLLYRSVLPMLSKQGHCIAGGRVPLLHRRTYGSFSDYGIYPRGFDGYDMFSLMEGSVEGDTQASRLLAPSAYNPKDLHDEDKVRVMPTLVPVRLKKAK